MYGTFAYASSQDSDEVAHPSEAFRLHALNEITNETPKTGNHSLGPVVGEISP